MSDFNGLGMSLGNLSRLSRAETRSISAENPNGEKGKGGMATEGTGARAARDLGQGWKVSPSIRLQPGEKRVIARIEGEGAIQHLWCTVHRKFWRSIILRVFWDDDPQPAVEVPLGDFFCQGWGVFAQVSSLPVAVNPHGGFNTYWGMPFRKGALIEIESLHHEPADLYYQVDYTLTGVPADCAYFHAQWRRSNPVPYKGVHTILDTVPGPGHYVGTYLAWGVNNNGWWGEGEVKFYLDGDSDYPTICGTGTEDYFGGAWNFDTGERYQEFSTPYLGLPQVLRPDGLY
ncbi:MAG TPA: glycoside hydrolase family 172 protein, partial [Deinococcales bacterium]|nr:glycoside hydrolase family 172 protein [Deinococcales bacterium]